MRIERLGDGGTPAEVLRALGRRAVDRQLPPPAALVGAWFGASAVLAPTVRAEPHPPGTAFDLPDHTDAVRDTDSEQPLIGGGWIGYLAYPDGNHRLPECAGGWTDSVLRLDPLGCWWYEALADDPCPTDLALAVTRPESDPLPWHIDWTPPDRDAHRNGVEQCLEAIRRGDVYQACVCTQFHGRWSGDPLHFFADAADRTQPKRAAFVQGNWGAVASLSPELYLSRHANDIQSSPIKGTAPLTEDPVKLRRSVKDVAENVMIVDLVRNDLGRVAVTGSVTVTDLLGVYPAPGVWHLVSTVHATVPPTTTTTDLLAASFPPASVTGCPKHRARQLLSAWEPESRGVYCGTVGMHSPIAGLELNVAIRTVEFDTDGTAVLGVGGGITIDSDPDAEWQECLDKASSILGVTPSVQPAPSRTAPASTPRV